jgi:N-acylneuraminate cytidylyltransferase
MTTIGLRRHGHRFFGRIRCVLVPDETAIEIDTPAELALAQALAAVLDRQSADLSEVAAVITDFDGVHTDDRASVDQHGIESVRVSRADGMGVARLRRVGLPFLIVSTERNPVVAARAAKLGVEVFSDVRDKAAVVLDWLAKRGIDPARTAYVGNDVNDLPALEVVGWPVAVADANPEVIRARAEPPGWGRRGSRALRAAAGGPPDQRIGPPQPFGPRSRERAADALDRIRRIPA